MILIIVVVVLLYFVVVSVTTYRLYQQIKTGQLSTQGFTSATIPDQLIKKGAGLGAPLVVPGAPRFGPEDAKVTIVEFGDWQCPFSRQAFSIFRTLMTRYAKQVQFVWRDFPISDIHPQAQVAAEAARCAHEQGKFWEYHDMLFLNQGDLTSPALLRYAAQVGLEEKKFVECTTSRRYQKSVEDDFIAGVANNVRGTPTFFLNGYQVTGVIPADLFVKAIERLLK